MSIRKKLCLLTLLYGAFALPSFSIEEVTDLEAIKPEFQKESLIDKIIKKENSIPSMKRVFHTEAKAWNILGVKGYEFESGPIKNIKINGYFRMDNEFTAKRHEDFSSKMTFDSVELQTETLFADEKTKLSVSYNFVRNLDYENNFFEKVSNLYVDHDFNKNQRIRIGQARVPAGIEGGLSSSVIKFVQRGQISRNFADARSVGIRNLGSYKYLDYDIGLYDSSRFMQKLFQGQEFAGIVSFKPLAHFNDKYGKLRLGASMDVGNAENSYSVFGAHAQYNYKKFYWDFEYAQAKGSGGKYIKRGDGHGFFSTVSYFILPSLELLARYDFYQNDNSDKITQEFTTGLNYYTHDNCKLVLNYVYAMSDTSSIPSHKIYLGARFSTSALLGDI